MIEISANVDARAALEGLKGLERQVPFILMVGINRTADDANAAIRDRMRKEFTIRDEQMPRWVAPVQLPKANRATKANPRAILETEGKGRMLAPFEAGIPHVAASIVSPVAIPTKNLRFTERTVVPRRWYPSSLGLTPRRDPKRGASYFALGRGAIKNRRVPWQTTARGATQIKGKLRTFVLDPRLHRGVSPQQWGVYIRIGPGRGDIRMLWRYAQQVRRPRVLGFEDTARAVVARRFDVNTQGALDLAIRTANR